MTRVYQHTQKYSRIYIQREHFFSQKNVFCNLLTHLPTTPKKKKKVLEKHRTMLSCTKPRKKGRRVARKFHEFVIKKSVRRILRRFSFIQRIPHCWNISILVLRMQSKTICPCCGFHLMLPTAGWGWIQVEIPSWAVSREKFSWNPPSSCSDRTQDDKGSSTVVCQELLSTEWAFPRCSLALLFQNVTTILSE